MTGSITVLNGRDQTIRFDGDSLAFASTYASGRSRWTEISIFRSVTGEYVVSKVGRSTVVHLQDSSCRRSYMQTIGRDDLLSTHSPCRKCNPDLGSALNIHISDANVPRLLQESSLFSAKVSAHASGAVAACYSKDKNGLFYLIEPAERPLEAAGALDDDLWQAFTNLDPASLRDCMATR